MEVRTCLQEGDWIVIMAEITSSDIIECHCMSDSPLLIACFHIIICSVGKRSGHIPYRDSKLTRILQHSLGGNARTAIICTLSPALSHVEQSRNTLFFATRAKEVTNNAQVNMVTTGS